MGDMDVMDVTMNVQTAHPRVHQVHQVQAAYLAHRHLHPVTQSILEVIIDDQAAMVLITTLKNHAVKVVKVVVDIVTADMVAPLA